MRFSLTIVIKAYSQCGWEEVEPGHYEYPFALKVNPPFFFIYICMTNNN
jgi:hypothetical protein